MGGVPWNGCWCSGRWLSGRAGAGRGGYPEISGSPETRADQIFYSEKVEYNSTHDKRDKIIHDLVEATKCNDPYGIFCSFYFHNGTFSFPALMLCSWISPLYFLCHRIIFFNHIKGVFNDTFC